jgi:hypothetical protein
LVVDIGDLLLAFGPSRHALDVLASWKTGEALSILATGRDRSVTVA